MLIINSNSSHSIFTLNFRSSAKSREGALLAFECLCEYLGRLFEPYVNNN